MVILQWLSAHWMDIAIAVLAIDKAVEKLFPNATVLGRIDAAVSKLVPPQS